MTKSKHIFPLLALVLCICVFFFPTVAFAQVNDTTPPTVTAELSGDTLLIQAKDDDSGVEAIYVDSHRFSTLVNGAASVKLSDYAGDGKQVAVYATDAAGNRSQSVLVDNPYYVEPTPTPAPSASAIAAASGSSITAGSAIPEPITPDSLPDIEASAESTDTTESVIAGGSTTFTPDGGGTVVDNATEEDGKEFFTVTATDGSVYYLVIDRQRGTENVYFLSAVTRDDLVSLTEDGAVIESDFAAPTPEPEVSANPAQEEAEDQEVTAQAGNGTGTIIFILLVVAIVGVMAYYFKVVKPRRQSRQAEEEEYEDGLDDEENGGDYLFDDEMDEYYHNGTNTEEAVDNDRAASYNTTNDGEDR